MALQTAASLCAPQLALWCRRRHAALPAVEPVGPRRRAVEPGQPARRLQLCGVCRHVLCVPSAAGLRHTPAVAPIPSTCPLPPSQRASHPRLSGAHQCAGVGRQGCRRDRCAWQQWQQRRCMTGGWALARAARLQQAVACAHTRRRARYPCAALQMTAMQSLPRWLGPPSWPRSLARRSAASAHAW